MKCFRFTLTRSSCLTTCSIKYQLPLSLFLPLSLSLSVRSFLLVYSWIPLVSRPGGCNRSNLRPSSVRTFLFRSTASSVITSVSTLNKTRRIVRRLIVRTIHFCAFEITAYVQRMVERRIIVSSTSTLTALFARLLWPP